MQGYPLTTFGHFSCQSDDCKSNSSDRFPQCLKCKFDNPISHISIKGTKCCPNCRKAPSSRGQTNLCVTTRITCDTNICSDTGSPSYSKTHFNNSYLHNISYTRNLFKSQPLSYKVCPRSPFEHSSFLTINSSILARPNFTKLFPGHKYWYCCSKLKC